MVNRQFGGVLPFVRRLLGSREACDSTDGELLERFVTLRDEAAFERADQFDIRRKPNRHLTFGAGAHHCLGANITRLETRICMEEVLRRLPDYQVIEAELEPIPDVSTMQGYLSVPVTFTPGRKVG